MCVFGSAIVDFGPSTVLWDTVLSAQGHLWDWSASALCSLFLNTNDPVNTLERTRGASSQEGLLELEVLRPLTAVVADGAEL